MPRARDPIKARLYAQSKALRRASTEAEALLWERLRSRKLSGLKFRRQQKLDRFIADFYCAEARLVVELDGDIHHAQIERDQVREAYLKSVGMRVIRFSNGDVLKRTDYVLRQIEQAVLLSRRREPTPFST